MRVRTNTPPRYQVMPEMSNRCQDRGRLTLLHSFVKSDTYVRNDVAPYSYVPF